MPKRVKTASLNADMQGSSKRARPEPQACPHDSSVRDAGAKLCAHASTLQPACWVPEGTPPTAPAPRDSLASSLTRAPVAPVPRTADPAFPEGARAEALRQHAALRRLAGLPAPARFVPVEGLGSGPTRPAPNPEARGSGAGSAASEPSSSVTAGFWGGPTPRAAPGATPEPAACASAGRAGASAGADRAWVAGRARAEGSTPCRAARKRPGKARGAVGGADAAVGGRWGGRGPPAWLAPERPLGPLGILTASMAQSQRTLLAGAARNRVLVSSRIIRRACGRVSVLTASDHAWLCGALAALLRRSHSGYVAVVGAPLPALPHHEPQ